MSKTNTEIDPEDYSTLNGKRFGVNKGSVQTGFFKDWAKMHGVSAEIVELTCSTDESVRMLHDGEIDIWISLDAYGDLETTVPICWIGSSDFYFTVNKDRPDLLSELNIALSDIRNEDKYFTAKLVEKYTKTYNANLILTPKERKWLSDHNNTIRIGYQDNYLAFCAADENGILTGALKEYLDLVSRHIGNPDIVFEAVSYPTAKDAINALINGDIDCMFPSNLSLYDAETAGLVITPTVISTDIYAIVRSSDRQSFLSKEAVTVAVNHDNPNYDIFLKDHFPDWKPLYCSDTSDCLKSVAGSKADCVLISNYRFSNLSKQCKRLNLTTVSMDVEIDYSFAVRESETELYMLFARASRLIPSSSLGTSLNYYSTMDATTTLFEIIMDNLAVLLLVFIILVALILLIVFQHRIITVQRKASESQQMVDELNKKVYTDTLTQAKNKAAFTNYIDSIRTRIDESGTADVAIGIFDCNCLKQINDKYGHSMGNIYLQRTCSVISSVFAHSPVFRIGGDEFAVILTNEDYADRKSLESAFEAAQIEQNADAQNPWEIVSIAAGFADYDPTVDHSLNDTVYRADQLMYENKRYMKNRPAD